MRYNSAYKVLFSMSLIIASTSLFSSCGWLRSLRQDVDDDDMSVPRVAQRAGMRTPAGAPLPPPATVMDKYVSAVQGTPVDLSGTRAKTERVTRRDFEDLAMKNENSLWKGDGQQNYFFATNREKHAGDIVTIQMEDGLRNDLINAVKKSLPNEFQEQDVRIPGLTKNVANAAGNAQRAVAGASADGANAANAATGAAEQAATAASNAAGTAINDATQDLITAEVLERYPNGNVLVRGVKKVPFKNVTRHLEVTAIVKGADIAEDNIVKSSKFYEHRVEFFR